ncbi:MAG: hypothetical protein Fur0022_46970 [Anaerolineales bacterium]
MKKPSVFLLIILIFTMLLITACGGGDAPAAEPTSPPVVEEPAAEEPVVEEPAAEEPASEETGSGEEPAAEEPMTEGPALDENGVPTDVPVPEAAYDLRVEANNTRISFKVDGTIQDVVAFFQEQLPTLGWTEVLGADSAIGSMGTLGRQNEQLDKLSINMSFNPNGNFVNITMDVIRAP